MRSDNVTKGMQQAPHRSLFNALGYTKEELDRPLVGIVSSYNEIVPGHMNLDKIVEAVKMGVAMAGGTPIVFPAIAVCDGIAMGHTGMKYSLVTRDLIADSTECMAMAHQFDALVMVPNCDKNVPGLLMAAARLNIPTVFVSGGPMLAGHIHGKKRSLSSMFEAVGSYAAGTMTEDEVREYEEKVCPTCGSCSGMYTANSMNCLTEALGLSLPGNGSTLATHAARKALFQRAGSLIVELAQRYYAQGDESVLPRSIANAHAFDNAMALDMAMGGSTNTVLHILAAAQEAELDFTLDDIDALSRRVGCLSKVAPNSDYHMEDVHRAGGIPAILGELHRGGLLHDDVRAVHADSLQQWLDDWDIRGGKATDEAIKLFHAAPGGERTTEPFSTNNRWNSLDVDAASGCIRDVEHAYTKDGGLAVLRGNLAVDGAIIKAAGVDESLWHFSGPARVVESQEEAVSVILNGTIQAGEVLVVRYEGPSGGPGMQEMLHPTAFLKGAGLGKKCALVTDGRFSWTVCWAHLPRGRARWVDWFGSRRRPDHH